DLFPFHPSIANDVVHFFNHGSPCARAFSTDNSSLVGRKNWNLILTRNLVVIICRKATSDPKLRWQCTVRIPEVLQLATQIKVYPAIAVSEEEVYASVPLLGSILEEPLRTTVAVADVIIVNVEVLQISPSHHHLRSCTFTGHLFLLHQRCYDVPVVL